MFALKLLLLFVSWVVLLGIQILLLNKTVIFLKSRGFNRPLFTTIVISELVLLILLTWPLILAYNIIF